MFRWKETDIEAKATSNSHYLYNVLYVCIKTIKANAKLGLFVEHQYVCGRGLTSNQYDYRCNLGIPTIRRFRLLKRWRQVRGFFVKLPMPYLRYFLCKLSADLATRFF